jgi:hypothetical protein
MEHDASINSNHFPRRIDMLSITRRISRTVRNASVIAAVCATATTLAAASPAHAQPPANGTPRGCPVEDEHGNVTYVPPGTIYLVFHCGTDGQWHWGLVTNDVATPPKGDRPIDTPPIIARAGSRVLAQHTQAEH